MTTLPPTPSAPVVVPGWIACSERMPKPGIMVLACARRPNARGCDYAFADWSYDHWWFHDDGPQFTPTHWMPLPPPPTGAAAPPPTDSPEDGK